MKTMNDTGLIEEVNPHSISGFCFFKNENDYPVISLYLDDILIKSRRADINPKWDVVSSMWKGSFSFRLGDNLLEKLYESSDIKIIMLCNDLPEELKFCEGISSNFNHGKGLDKNKELKEMLETNWHIDHWGNLQIPFGKQPNRKKVLLDLYCDVKKILKSKLDIDIYLTGGNLLGLIREGDFLDHDDDIDSAFCVNIKSHLDAPQVFLNLYKEIENAVRTEGYKTFEQAVGHIQLVNANSFHLDIFMGWLLPDGTWFRMSGFLGNIGKNSFELEEYKYLDSNVFIPKHAQRELEITFGKNWNTKDPFFSKDKSQEILNLLWKLRKQYLLLKNS
jgi:hypothetical protein